MKWKYKTLVQKDAQLEQWHKWFAWYPVRYKGKAYWLEYVERRIFRVRILWECFESTEYRDINL